MSKLTSLDGDKLRLLEVRTTFPKLSFVNTVYDEGERLWKVENGLLFVNEISLVRHPNEDFEPRWKPVLRAEDAEEVVVYSWPTNTELERHKVNAD